MVRLKILKKQNRNEGADLNKGQRTKQMTTAKMDDRAGKGNIVFAAICV